MSKRRKAGTRQDPISVHGIHRAIDHSRVRRGRRTSWRRGQFLILLLFATVVAGVLFARTRIPGVFQNPTHDGGAPYFPGATVRFGHDQAVNKNDTLGEVVDPDTTEIPAPEANGKDATGGGGSGATAE